ncbi:hypothetical protein DY000_02055393 [Brassica cretica]|uniref:Secreted protein n=2 Tax=Brassica cretica TaxID=69181 RepID=A0ABQ7ADP8_BRACR|nr:hypothetical protein DY000_02055393 [Brassica cretica]
MTFALKYFVDFLSLFSAVSQGVCLCTFREIQIDTVRTRREFAGQPLWKAIVINTGTCRHKHVTLSCSGFNFSCETCQVMVLHPQRNTCLLIKRKAFQLEPPLTSSTPASLIFSGPVVPRSTHNLLQFFFLKFKQKKLKNNNL